MAISFACPGCKTLVQVGDELAGATGQCPRCERLIIIPSSQTPMPILLDEQGRPVPMPAPTPSRVGKPAAPPIREEETPRSRRGMPAEKKPAGPTWPWVIGVLGAIVIVGLLFASFITLFAYRPREVKTNLIVVEPRRTAPGVTVGRLEGQRAFLENGVFQIRSATTPQDNFDGGQGVWGQFPTKRFEIELQPNQGYFLEVDSKQFSSFIRVDDHRGNVPPFQGVRGVGHARIEFWPVQGAGFVTVHAGVFEGSNREFTLTIRRVNQPKPGAP